jgi:hypothetical protein
MVTRSGDVVLKGVMIGARKSGDGCGLKSGDIMYLLLFKLLP